jgi:hypothetical protein
MGTQTDDEAGRERPHWGRAQGRCSRLGPGSLTSRLPPFSLWGSPAGLGAAKNAVPAVARQLRESSRVTRHVGAALPCQICRATGGPLTRAGERSCEEAFAPPFAGCGGSGRADQGGEVLIRMRQNMTLQLAASARQRLGQDL